MILCLGKVELASGYAISQWFICNFRGEKARTKCCRSVCQEKKGNGRMLRDTPFMCIISFYLHSSPRQKIGDFLHFREKETMVLGCYE